MTKAKQRSIALSAVRAQLPTAALLPELTTASEAHAVLDDLCRAETDLIACQWYSNADDSQLSLFYRDWEVWLVDQPVSAGPFVSEQLQYYLDDVLSQEF